MRTFRCKLFFSFLPMAHILLRVDHRKIGFVTIQNQAKLNTLNRVLMEQFIAVFESLAADETLRAVIVTGAGEKAFIGGADIHEMAELDTNTAAGFITRLHRCCAAVRDLPVPVIARIQGYALGAGLELAAACDLRIAADAARFGMPEVKLGIPSVIEAALLPGLIGWGRTRRMLLLGEMFDAREVERWGLVEAVVPKPMLDNAVERMIEAILLAGPRAVRLQKKLIRRWEDLPLREAVEAGIDTFPVAWETSEPVERMRDFLMGIQRGRE
jgi:enoyl-CoA hydratase